MPEPRDALHTLDRYRDAGADARSYPDLHAHVLALARAGLLVVVDEQDADELLADIDLGGVLLLRPRHHADLGIAEHALEIGVELPDFLNVHGGLQCASADLPGVLGRDGRNG